MRTIIQILITLTILYVLLSAVRVMASPMTGFRDWAQNAVQVHAVVEGLTVEPTTSSPENIQPAFKGTQGDL